MNAVLPISPDAISHSAMMVGAQIALALSAEIIVLQIRAHPCPLPELARLYTLTAPIRAFGVQTRLRVREGDPAELICQEGIERRCEWIIMGSGGDGRRLGSVAEAVFLQSPVPVILARETPTLRPAVELTFQSAHHAVELIGRLRAAGLRWDRPAPRRVRVDLADLMLSPAS
ncbi:MAG: nucleotide-binding universal stress UspA family protein [Myxococcota bacterium]|jgi:nucleotide-binding universal stress UspA family protein